MTNASVAADFNKSLNVESNVSSKVALNHEVVVDIVTELSNIVFAEVLDSDIRVYTCVCENFIRRFTAYSVDISESDFNSLILGKVNTGNTCH